MTTYALVTVNTGGYAPASVVNTIHRLAEHHCPVGFKHYCITDRPDGLDAGVTPIPPVGYEGWWGKMQLYGHKWAEERFVYLDLDCLPMGAFDDLVTGYNGDFCGDEDHIHYGQSRFTDHHRWGTIDCSLGTAFIHAKTGSPTVKQIWKKWNECNQGTIAIDFKRLGDQAFTSWACGGQFDLLERVYPQSHGFYSYRFNWLGDGVKGLVNTETPKLEQVKLLNFHGKPKWWQVDEPIVNNALLLAQTPIGPVADGGV